jgi:N-methylhydantoinase A/oxoprolinase/acetone carboxylase beta subunit
MSQSDINTSNVLDSNRDKTFRQGTSTGERYVVDIDIGGTNTDALISKKDEFFYLKVDTTPHDLSECFKAVLEKGASQLGISDLGVFLQKIRIIRLSTSLSTNALMEKKEERIGMLVSKGWRVPFLDQFLHFKGAGSLVSPDMIEELDSRIDENDIREKTYQLLIEGAISLVISLDAGPEFSTSEKQVKSIINRYFAKHFIGSVPILCCSQVSKDQDYCKRTNTATLNAYTYDTLSRHLLGIEDLLRDMGYPYPLLLVHANGGSARAAKSTAIQTLSSGTAAGIYGALRLFKHYNKPHIFLIDVGGTSTEIGLIQQGTITYAESPQFGELPIDVPSSVNATLGIGGGSIVRIDDGALELGPDSAGAFPGPACYDLGGMQPTLTDAYLVLGYFDENDFLGGQKRIKKDLAENIIKNMIADPLDITCEEAALLIKNNAVEVIGKQIRTIIESIFSAASAFSLFAVGGGGGCIGADLADFVGIEETYVFQPGAIFGAFGSSAMDIMHQYKSQIQVPWEKGDTFWKKISVNLNKIVLALQRIAAKDMAGEGFTPERVHYVVELELLSPLGKMYRLELPSPFLWLNSKQRVDIEEQIEKLFFHSSSKAEFDNISLTGLLLNAVGRIPHTPLAHHRKRTVMKNTKKKMSRNIYTAQGCWVEAPVYRWDELSLPQMIEGPALVESKETTVVLPQGKILDFDEYGNGVMKGSIL